MVTVSMMSAAEPPVTNWSAVVNVTLTAPVAALASIVFVASAPVTLRLAEPATVNLVMSAAVIAVKVLALNSEVMAKVSTFAAVKVPAV